MPSLVFDNQIPLSILFHLDPIYSILPRVFGCICFVHNLSPGRDKLSAHVIKCVFVGITLFSKRVIDITLLHIVSTSLSMSRSLRSEDTPYSVTSDAPPVDSDHFPQVLLIPHIDSIVYVPIALDEPPTSSSPRVCSSSTTVWHCL